MTARRGLFLGLVVLFALGQGRADALDDAQVPSVQSLAPPPKGKGKSWLEDPTERFPTADVSARSGNAEVGEKGVIYTYDALGRRVTKRATVNDAGGTFVRSDNVAFICDGPREIEEVDLASGVLLAKYVWGQGLDELCVLQNQNGRFAVCADHQDTAMLVCDLATGLPAERYEYTSEYGAHTVRDPGSISTTGGPNVLGGPRALASEIRNPFRFQGRRFDDESGLYYFRNRFLDPEEGRFVNRDPIGVWGDSGNLGNGYAFCGGNPVNRRDPFGLDTPEVTLVDCGRTDAVNALPMWQQIKLLMTSRWQLQLGQGGESSWPPSGWSYLPPLFNLERDVKLFPVVNVIWAGYRAWKAADAGLPWSEVDKHLTDMGTGFAYTAIFLAGAATISQPAELVAVGEVSANQAARLATAIDRLYAAEPFLNPDFVGPLSFEQTQAVARLTGAAIKLPLFVPETTESLVAELAANGIKHSPQAIVRIARDSAGKVVFLEAGNTRAGLVHIVQEHGAEFAEHGISEAEIPDVVMEAVTRGGVCGTQGTRPPPRLIYRITWKGKPIKIAASVGDNGFVVGANPTTAGD